MKKWIFLILAIGLVAGLAIGYYMYNEPLEGMDSQEAEITISAKDLYASFDTDEANANATFLGKVVEVSGEIQTISDTEEGQPSILLDAGGMMGGVICRLDQGITGSFSVGQNITFRGECTGKLMDVELARCVPVE
ncbi:MAG: OB-fold putative lipoprotein [Saprospiraceae bacterium]|nr:OB-fold putative lipoprotein [Saprospiraceae bacterium]